MNYTDRIRTEELHDHIGAEVTLAGWVSARRDHGKLIFIDLKDATGVIQMVSKPGSEAHEQAEQVRDQWCIAVTGHVKERPEKMVNSDQANGDLEFEVTGLEVLSEAETPPFELDTDGYEVGEEHRMEHRYLDLRRDRMRRNIQTRAKVNSFFRNHLTGHGFTEVETPSLTSSSPEGARDYVVPSRIEQGAFYALPQAPQQFKQMLMVAGFERYFQIARCFRDEDTRGDRQPEFTQLDIELSFVGRDEIMALVEEMLTRMITELYPDKTIRQTPWPRLSYRDVMDQYGTDRPDLRNDKEDPDELAFAWIIDFPLFEDELENDTYAPSHHMFTMPNSEDLDLLSSEPQKVRSTQMDIVLNGSEIAGGSVRIHDRDIQKQIFDLIGFSEEEQQRFAHMLEAFRYGVPPHGGIAAGLDRLLAILQDEPSIREIIAFPKTGEGRDLMMNAPSEISQAQLDELGLKIDKEDE